MAKEPTPEDQAKIGRLAARVREIAAWEVDSDLVVGVHVSGEEKRRILEVAADSLEELALASPGIEQQGGEVKRLRAERDFLLERAKAAGSFSMRMDRWTGASSNALVAVAFGGQDNTLPHDGDDLAACYRTVKRLPGHLLSDAVLDSLSAVKSS